LFLLSVVIVAITMTSRTTSSTMRWVSSARSSVAGS
jgi:hypothetical protein